MQANKIYIAPSTSSIEVNTSENLPTNKSEIGKINETGTPHSHATGTKIYQPKASNE